MRSSIIRIAAALLTALNLLSALTSCTGSTGQAQTDSSSYETESLEASSPQTKEPEAETDAPKSYITLNSSNASKVKFVRSAAVDKHSTEMELIKAFSQQITQRLDVSFSFTSDVSAGKYIDDHILISLGDTSLDPSRELTEKLAKTGGNAYGMIVKDNIIAVSGTDFYFLFMALDHILTSCISNNASGQPQLSFEENSELIESGLEYPDPEEIIKSGKSYAFYSIKKLADVPTTGSFSVLQGGGTDGKYAYYAMISKATKPEKAIIYKYDLSTWELTATSKALPSAHTNDITYDAKNDRLVISYCANKAGDVMSSSGLVFVDPNDLTFIEYIDAPTTSRGIDYLPQTNQYILGAGYTFYLTDEKFNTISYFTCGYPQLTTQGLCTDGKYIYDPRWKSGAKYQTITVNTLEGKFIKAVPLYNISGEPENLFRDGNSFVMGCNGSDAVFRLILLYEGWWQEE